MEIRNLPDKEFRVMVTNMFPESIFDTVEKRMSL